MTARTDRNTPRYAASLPRDARAIIAEEVGILNRLQQHLAGHRPDWRDVDYDEALLELRDSLGEAQDDEVAQIVQQMANLASLSSHHRQHGAVAAIPDAESPYFGHLRIRQNQRERDLLIGNRTLAGPGLPYAIIDWRHAPISRVFYQYREDDEYEEEIGGRVLEGRILAHRRVMILEGRLLRIECPQGTYVLERGRWREASTPRLRLSGGQGAALRPGGLAPLGGNGPGLADGEKRLTAITGLIDPAQFQLITRPESGLVVIDGGAGSGKTTIALHRIAYLAYQDPERFAPKSMLAVVFGRALANYIAFLLPALGVEGVRIEAFEQFVSELRRRHFPGLEVEYEEGTPATVIRFKQHPAVWAYLSECIQARTRDTGDELAAAAAGTDSAGRVREGWASLADLPLSQRLGRFADWVRAKGILPGLGAFGDDWLARDRLTDHLAGNFGPELAHPSTLAKTLWQEAFLRLDRLTEAMGRLAPGEFTPAQLEEVRDWAFKAYSAQEDHLAAKAIPREEREEEAAERGNLPAPPPPEPPWIDREDDTLLLLLYARMAGPLLSRRRRPLRFAHLMVDEAQDLSPLDLRVLIGLAADPLSVTLAGDTDQRMIIHNAFTRWEDVIEQLGLESTAIRPLRVGYRSTAGIMDFARAVLGPLATGRPWIATREGAPVSLLRFTDAGQAVAVLAEELLRLLRAEPAANIVLIARNPARADLYFEGLSQADLPALRRVADQDFRFTPGVEVTDVYQVKGLEFDYVILLDVDAATYPEDDASRYLLHIAATRAAHQLVLTACRAPSPLIPAGIPVYLT